MILIGRLFEFNQDIPGGGILHVEFKHYLATWIVVFIKSRISAITAAGAQYL